MDFYAILGCTPEDSPTEVRKKWRAKCLEHHPDTGGDEDEFLRVMHAYKMISDPDYRRREEAKPARDINFRIQMVVGFMEAFYGTRMTVNYNRVHLDRNLEPIRTKDIEPVSIAFDLPAGSTEGFKHVEKNKGMICGSQMGDAVITVVSENHPRYKVKSPDVFTEENVPLDIMLKGGEVAVETLWGHRVIWVPPGTCPKARVAVPECGVNQNGYQYCAVNPVYPSQMDLKTSRWSGLDINWEKAKEKNRQDHQLIKRFEELRRRKREEEQKKAN